MRSPRTVLAVLAFFWVAVPGCAAEAPRRPELTPCKKPGMPPEALCGTYEVFENRATRSGRTIPLHIVVLPATGPDRLSDPFVYFAGGPGEASIPWGFFWTQQLASLRLKRDVLLIDLRGTGRSGELSCPELRGEQSIQGFLDDFLPVDKVHACRDRLKKEVDLSWYTTDATVDDVEEVRVALGYGPLNLMGTSYGTRTVLTYLRRHPRSVRTATMDHVMAPDVKFLLTMPRNFKEALDGLIAECEGDPACRGAFPKLREEMDAVLRRATTEPVRVELIDPETGQTQEVRLTRTAVAQTLRYMLYAPMDAVRVPLEIHQAAQGDWKPLALSARSHGNMSGSAEGLYQSVTCAEDVAVLRDEEIAAVAAADTLLGDFRLRRQKAACEGWPIRDLGSDFQNPVVADVPSLLISGERDPATPASNGARVAKTLKRSRHLIVTDGAHSLDGMQGADCVVGLIASFIEAGAVDGLDTACLDRMRRPELVLSFGDPEVTVARADLERLPGAYVKSEWGVKARVDLLGSRVRFGLGEGPRYMLIPTSPTHFRVEGLPPGHKVAFQVIEGRTTKVTLSQPGRPDLVMTRQ
jgi:pimeloyl-ACP methyl ester carboxylesterase